MAIGLTNMFLYSESSLGRGEIFKNEPTSLALVPCVLEISRDNTILSSKENEKHVPIKHSVGSCSTLSALIALRPSVLLFGCWSIQIQHVINEK